MSHIRKSGNALPLLAAAVLLGIQAGKPAAAAPAKKPMDMVPALQKEVKDFLAVRDKLAASLATDPDQHKTGVMQVVIANPRGGRHMTLNLVCKDGAWHMGWARLFTRHSSRAEIMSAALKGDDFEAKVRINFIPQEMRRGAYNSILHRDNRGPFPLPYTTSSGEVLHRDGRPIPMECSIKCSLKRGKPNDGKGTITVLNTKNGPFRSGDVAVTCEWIPAGKPKFPPFPKSPALSNVFQDAAFIADRGRIAYEQIRALELQKRTGIPFALGLPEITHTPLTRKQPKAGDDGGKKKQKKAFNSKKVIAPDLDDLEDDIGLDDVVETSADKADAAKEQRALNEKMVKELQKVQRHIRQMRSLVEAWQKNGSAGPEIQRGDIATADPDFGPWSRPDPLPATKDGANKLPVNVGSDGPQFWPYLTGWRVMGPVPVLNIDSHSVLPDIVPDPDSVLIVQTNRFGWSRERRYYGTGRSPWVPTAADFRDGFVTAPKYSTWGRGAVPGILYGGFLGMTCVDAPADVETWASFACPSRGAVWVNNRLVWSSGWKEDLDNWFIPQRFKLPLKKGRNTVVVRSDAYHQPLGFTMRVCVQGKPRSAEQVAQDKAAVDAAYAKLDPVYDRLTGGECNATRQYPDCKPPVAWDLEKGVNVKWRTWLPCSRGGSIVVGDRLFVPWEPFTLVCLDKNTGRILWRRHLDSVQLQHPDIWEQEKAYIEKFDKMDLKRTLTKEETKQRAALVAERKAFLAKHKVRGLSIAGGEMQRSFGRGGGATMSNPFSDGKHVYMKTVGGGGQIIACYDLDGNRKWMKILEKRQGGTGGMVYTPLIMGDQIILQVGCYGMAKAKKVPVKDAASAIAGSGGCDAGALPFHQNSRKYCLMALDKNTGEPRWESNAYAGQRWGNKYDADCLAQPIPLRLTNGKDSMDVVVHSSVGAVVRVKDGKELMRYCGALANNAPPVDDGRDTVWFSEHQFSAVKFSMFDRDNIFARVLFRHDIYHGSRKFTQSRDLMLHDDRVSRLDGGNLAWFDRETGAHMGRRPGEFWPYPAEGMMYMPTMRARNVLYCGSTMEGSKVQGAMNTVLASNPPMMLARNWMVGASSAPVAEDDCLYVRAAREVICFGYTGDAGRKYEADEVGRTLIPQIPPAPPANDLAVVELNDEPTLGWANPLGDVNRVGGLGSARIRVGVPVAKWKVSEPLPPSEVAWVDEFYKKVVETGKYPYGYAGTMKSADGKKTMTERTIELESRVTSGGGGRPGYDWEKVASTNQRYGLFFDLGKFHSSKPGTICYWATELVFDREMTLRLSLGRNRNIKVWIDGREVKDGQRVHGVFGSHRMIMRTEVGNVDELKDTIRPVFTLASSPEYEIKHRKTRIAAARPWIEMVAAEAGDADVKKWAVGVLKEL